MSKIATWGDLNAAFNMSNTPSNRCPTWAEITATGKVTIAGSLFSGSQLVELDKCSSAIQMQTITVTITYYYYDYEVSKWLIDKTFAKNGVGAKCGGYFSSVRDLSESRSTLAVTFAAPVGQEILLQGYSSDPNSISNYVPMGTLGVPAPNGPINVQGTTEYNINAVYLI